MNLTCPPNKIAKNEKHQKKTEEKDAKCMVIKMLTAYLKSIVKNVIKKFAFGAK